jgi:hypothetical protein
VYTDQCDLVQLPHGDGEVAPQLDISLVGYPMPFGKNQHANADLTLAGDVVPPFAAPWPTTRLVGYMTQRSLVTSW